MEAHTTGLTVGPVFSIPTKKLAMWLFIIADTMTFSACLVAYGFVRNGASDWPRPFHSITNVALMTFILLTSSLTMLLGLRAARAGDKAGAFRWIMITAVTRAEFCFRQRISLSCLDQLFGKLPCHQLVESVRGAGVCYIFAMHMLHVTVT